MTAVKLTQQAVTRILKDGEEDIQNLVVQILDLVKQDTDGIPRHRLRVSDGVTFCFGRLSAKMNKWVLENSISNCSIIEVGKYTIFDDMENRKLRIMILSEAKLIVSGEDIGKIGNPKPWKPEVKVATSPATAIISLPSTSKICTSVYTTDLQGNLRNSENSPVVVPTKGQNSFPQKNEQIPGNSSNTNSRALRPNSLKNNSSSSSSVINRARIEELNRFCKKTVTVLARVTIKSDVHPIKRSGSNEDTFCMHLDLLDLTGEVKLVLYDDDVEKFANQVYWFRKFNVILNRTYSTLYSDSCELECTRESQIVLVKGNSDIPRLTFNNFAPIAQIENMEVDTKIDVLVICHAFEDSKTVIPKIGSNKGRSLTKRELFVIDQSNCEITLTIWGSNTLNFDADSKPILAIKRAKVSHYYGKSLNSSCLSSSTYQINPDIPQAQELRHWYSTRGQLLQAEVKYLSNNQM